MQVVEHSLVEYFEACRFDLLRQGFHVLILALVREADAPLFYSDLTRYWDSINDVTGRNVVFAVAGRKAAEGIGLGAVHGDGYSEHMTVADQQSVEIETLRSLTGRRKLLESYLDGIAEANTGQISALCEHLGVEERDLPCLHLTHLKTGKALVLPQADTPGATVYTACKAIVAHLQPSFRSFDKVGNAESVSELSTVRCESQPDPIKQLQQTAAKEIEVSFLSLPAFQVASKRKEWDVFLSYPAENRDAAIGVFKGLEGTCQVFLDWFCLLPGQDWQSLLPDIQRGCRSTIALVSRHSQRAHFHVSEIQRAINLMRKGNHKVLPVYLDDEVTVPFGLEQVHSIYWSRCPGGDPLAVLRSILVEGRNSLV